MSKRNNRRNDRNRGQNPWLQPQHAPWGRNDRGGYQRYDHSYRGFEHQWRRPSRFVLPAPPAPKLTRNDQQAEEDAKSQAEKQRKSDLVKTKLQTLTAEDKSSSMKQLLAEEVSNVLEASQPLLVMDKEKESKRIAHVPKPKPLQIPPPPSLPFGLISLIESEPLKTPPPPPVTTENDLQENIKRTLFKDLLSMPLTDLKRMVTCPKSRRDNLFLSHLLNKTKSSISEAMRKLTEHKLQAGIVDSAKMLTELENLVDPDIAVDVCGMSVETIRVLGDIFGVDLETELDVNSTMLSPNEDKSVKSEICDPSFMDIVNSPFRTDIEELDNTSSCVTPTSVPPISKGPKSPEDIFQPEMYSETFQSFLNPQVSDGNNLIFLTPSATPEIKKPLFPCFQAVSDSPERTNTPPFAVATQMSTTPIPVPACVPKPVPPPASTIVPKPVPRPAATIVPKQVPAPASTIVPKPTPHPTAVSKAAPTPVPTIVPKSVPVTAPMIKKETGGDAVNEKIIALIGSIEGLKKNVLENLVQPQSPASPSLSDSLKEKTSTNEVVAASSRTVIGPVVKPPIQKQTPISLSDKLKNMSQIRDLEIQKKMAHMAARKKHKKHRHAQKVKNLLEASTQTWIYSTRSSASQANILPKTYSVLTQASRPLTTSAETQTILPSEKFQSQEIQTTLSFDKTRQSSTCEDPQGILSSDSTVSSPTSTTVHDGLITLPDKSQCIPTASQETQTTEEPVLAPRMVDSSMNTDHAVTQARGVQCGVEVSHRGQQVNRLHFTNNRTSQTSSHSRSKTDSGTSKKSTEQPKVHRSTEVLAGDSKKIQDGSKDKPVEAVQVNGNSLLEEFELFKNDVQALGAGSLVRRMLVNSMAGLMTSAFNNLYNLFANIEPGSMAQRRKRKETLDKTKKSPDKMRPVHPGSAETMGKRKRDDSPKNKKLHAKKFDKGVKRVKEFGDSNDTSRSAEVRSPSVGKSSTPTPTPSETKSVKSAAGNTPSTLPDENLRDINKTADGESSKLSKSHPTITKEKQETKVLTAPENVQPKIKVIESLKHEDKSRSEVSGSKKFSESSSSESAAVKTKKRKSVDDEDLHNSEANTKSTELKHSGDKKAAKKRKSALMIYSGTSDSDNESVVSSISKRSNLADKPATPVSDDHLRSSKKAVESDDDRSVKNSSFAETVDEPSSPARTADFIKLLTNLPQCIIKLDHREVDLWFEKQMNKPPPSPPMVVPEEETATTATSIAAPAPAQSEHGSGGGSARSTPVDFSFLNETISQIAKMSHIEDSDYGADTVSDVSDDSREPKKKIILASLDFVGHTGDILDFKVNGNHLLAGGEDKIVHCYSLRTGKRKRVYSGHSDNVNCLAVCGAGESQVIFTSCKDNMIRAFSLQQSTLLKCSENLGGSPTAICVVGKSVFVGLDTGAVLQLNSKTLKISKKYQVGKTAVVSIAVGPVVEDKVLIAATADCGLLLQDVKTGHLQQKLNWNFESPIRSLRLHNEQLYCASELPHLVIFNLGAIQESEGPTVVEMGGPLVSLRLINNSILCASASGDISVVDIKTQVKVDAFSKQGEELIALDVYKKKMVVASYRGGKLQSWPIPTKIRKLL